MSQAIGTTNGKAKADQDKAARQAALEQQRAEAKALMGSVGVEVTQQDMQDELAKLRAENARLKAARGVGRLTLKVSEKGALSVYGLGRFPVTLYREQWGRLLGAAEDIREFIAAAGSELKTKE